LALFYVIAIAIFAGLKVAHFPFRADIRVVGHPIQSFVVNAADGVERAFFEVVAGRKLPSFCGRVRGVGSLRSHVDIVRRFVFSASRIERWRFVSPGGDDFARYDNFERDRLTEIHDSSVSAACIRANRVRQEDRAIDHRVRLRCIPDSRVLGRVIEYTKEEMLDYDPITRKVEVSKIGKPQLVLISGVRSRLFAKGVSLLAAMSGS
jgi:hypothetical protein